MISTQTTPSVSIRSGLPGIAPRPRAAPVRAFVWQQALAVAVAAAIVAAIAFQAATNLRARGIASGFDFLDRAAGFEIARGPIEFSSRDTYARALLVGLFNTLRVSLLGIVLATTLGVALGVARLSNVWVVAAIARGYVEVMRNTPLLLQLLFWYSLWQALPAPREALNPLPGVFLCFRGLFLPSPIWQTGYPWISMERPVLAGFGFQGGASVSPEFAALLVGLTMYTSALIGRSFAAASLPSTRDRVRPRLRSACRGSGFCASSFCRRLCASSSRPPPASS